MTLAPIIGSDPVVTSSWLYSGIATALLFGVLMAIEWWRRR